MVALGATTNAALVPGSHAALTFKTVAEALVLRTGGTLVLAHVDSPGHESV